MHSSGLGRATDATDDRAAAENGFVWNGDGWTLTFAGKTVTLYALVGLSYLRGLIARKGKSVHAAVLLADQSGRPGQRLGVGSELLDAQARGEYAHRYDDLRFQLEEAQKNHDLGRQERVQGEIDTLTRRLEEAAGLGGRPRKAGDDGERVRKAVSNGIDRAITKIGKKHAALGRHLSNSVSMGQYLRYSPEPDIDWTV